MELKRSKKLGFGLMRLPVLNKTDVSSVDINLTSQMVDTFMENGFDYFDTAWTYHGFASETVVKEVLTKRYPREKFRLATKIHLNYFNTPTERENIFNEELKKTGVDYFDYYLLHSLEEKRFNKAEQLNCFEWLADKKEKGFVNQIGFSYHDNAELLDAILSKHPEIDFVQLQVNYLDWDSK